MSAGTCRLCGCTDDDCRQCIEKTGEPCSWVEADLCSACVPGFRVWKNTERPLIEYEGRRVRGFVLLASANGKSLMLGFEALLGGYAGMMPVLWSEEQGCFVDLICEKRVGLGPS